MKKAFRFILALALAVTVYGQSVSDQAKSLFEKGSYLEGTNLLLTQSNSSDPLEKTEALKAFAEYQEQLVGNVEYALRLYANVREVQLPADSPLKAAAEEQMRRIANLRTQYRAEDVLLRSLQPPEVADSDRRNRQAILLQAVAEKRPDYYRIYEVYYQLGRHYLVTQDYRLAYLLFQKTLRMKPAVNFYLPLNTYLEKARVSWIRANVNTASLAVAGVLLLIAAVSFCAGRPWRWLRLRHLLIGLLAAAAWLIAFLCILKLLAAMQTMPDESVAQISVAPPYYVSYGPAGPHWHVVRNWLIVGFVGIAGTFFFSMGLAGLKNRWTAAVTAGVFSFVLFASLMTMFYMHNCDQKSMFFSPSNDGIGRFLGGASYFVDYGMEPYILTEPRAYPDLTLQNVTDVHLNQWIQTYCPFSSANGAADNTNEPAK